MANTNTVTDYEDPFQLADLAKREGPEGLLRLADYFETTGQQTPLTVKTALAMSRGPGVFPIKDATIGAPTSRPPPIISGEFDFFERNPTAEIRADGQVYDRGAGTQLAKSMREALAQSDAPTSSFLRQTTVPDYGSPAGPVTGSLAPSVSGARPAKKDEYDLTEQEIQDEAKGFGITLEQMRAWLAQERSRKQQSASPASSAARPTPTRRAAPSPEAPGPVPSFTLEDVPSGPIPSFTLEDVAQGPTPEAIAKIARRNVSLTSPIPVANAPSGSDVSAATASTLPSVTSDQPAGKPDSSDKDGMVAPSSEGAGGDASERDLYLARLAAQNAAGFGGMGAGKNIDMGIADTLGERLKQVQALRAKREERSADVAQEQAQYEGANLATLATQLAAFKDRPDIVAALQNLKPGAKYTKPSEFIKSAYQAVTNPPTVAAKEATTGKTLVQIPDIQAGTAGKVAKTAEIGPEGESKRKLRAAQVAKIYKDMELAGAKLALDERKTLEQAQQSRDPFKKLESLNTIADKKEFGGFTTLAGDLGDLERVAPGFVTRGEVPEWLTREQQALGQNWPTSTDPRVVDFLAAYGKVANEERHRQYGSAQTDGELRAFMQQLNASPLSAGPQVLAQQVKRFGQAAGRVAKGRLTRYNNVFGAENVDTVFAPEWRPLFDTGGVFAGQGSPFVAARPAAGGEAPAPVGGVAEAAPAVSAGKTALWDAARNKWMQIPNDKVDAAVSSGKYRRTR